MALDIGRIAYQAYASSLSSFVAPPWENIGQEQQNAWRAGALASHRYLEQEQERTEAGDQIIG